MAGTDPLVAAPDPAVAAPARSQEVVITGGCGFLGRKLATRLLSSWPELIRLRLLDQAEPSEAMPELDDPRVELLIGDVTDTQFLSSAITAETGVVFHLASVVSAGAEQNFDLGYAVNLFGTLSLLEHCRALGTAPMVVFTSSLATFGTGAAGPAPDGAVDDQTGLRPETSYGVQKACCELLINDYHRKGFVDGRVLRLPTVVVRPGKPNLAASGFASGIIREPLAGIDMVCPVAPETVMAVISPGRVIDSFERIAGLADAELGVDRTVLLPGLSMSMADAIEATVAESEGKTLGRVTFAPDQDIQRIIDSWPPAIVSERASQLGFVGDRSVGAIVRQHIHDELGDEIHPDIRHETEH